MDSFARKLKVLLEDGQLAASLLSGSQQERLGELVGLKVLEETLVRGKRVVVVRQREALLAWVEALYPSGLDPVRVGLPRAAGVLGFRDSKRGGRVGRSLVFIRALGPCWLLRGEERVDVWAQTQLLGGVGLVVGAGCGWALSGRVGIVENLEVFLEVERIRLDVDVVLYAGGRMSEVVLGWLEGAVGAVVHCGDYDPVGVDEFVRLRRRLGDRVSLFLPENLEGLMRSFGRADLLSDSVGVLERLRRLDWSDVQFMVTLWDRLGVGLEQEILLV